MLHVHVFLTSPLSTGYMPNSYCESLNARMRDEFLNGELFDTITEAAVLTRRWVHDYNAIRPHSALGYCPPTPQAFLVIA